MAYELCILKLYSIFIPLYCYLLLLPPPPIALYTIRGEIVLYWLIFLSINLEGVVECKRRKLTIEMTVVGRLYLLKGMSR
jgi:hypothetical protein